MADQDLSDIEGTNTSKLVGSDSVGEEETPIGSTSDRELFIRDTHNNGGLDIIIALTTTPSEGKVGLAPKANRKYVVFEALDTGVTWGFSNSSQSFDLFKSQLIMLPIGENTEVWFKMRNGNGAVAFGEIS